MSTLVAARQRRLSWTIPRLALEPAVAILVWVYLARHLAMRLGDPDFWGRIAVGQWFLAWGEMPRHDPFSYTPQLPQWVDHEWLTGVVFYVLYVNWGDAGVLVFKTALGLMTIAFTAAIARLHTPLRLPIWMLLAVAMPVFGYSLLPRAQLFTFAAFAGWMFLLERHRLEGRAWPLVWLPLSMVAWANLHGGFLAGLGLVALYGAGAAILAALESLGWSQADTRSRGLIAWHSAATLLLVGLLAAAASLVNPYGLDYWRYLLDAVSMKRPGIREWHPVPLELGYVQFWVLATLAVAALWLGRRRWLAQPAVALVLMVTLFLAVRHARHMPFMATAVCGLGAGVLFTPQRLRRLPMLTGEATDWPAWVPVALVGIAVYQGYALAKADGPWQFRLPETENVGVENAVDFPVRALDWAVRNDLRGNVATPFNWGQYALWRLWPNCLVSMDGRYETVYPTSTVEMVERFYMAEPGWRDLLDSQPTDHILAPRLAPVNEQLARDAGWVQRYADGLALIWSRTSRGESTASRP